MDCEPFVSVLLSLQETNSFLEFWGTSLSTTVVSYNSFSGTEIPGEFSLGCCKENSSAVSVKLSLSAGLLVRYTFDTGEVFKEFFLTFSQLLSQGIHSAASCVAGGFECLNR